GGLSLLVATIGVTLIAWRAARRPTAWVVGAALLATAALLAHQAGPPGLTLLSGHPVRAGGLAACALVLAAAVAGLGRSRAISMRLVSALLVLTPLFLLAAPGYAVLLALTTWPMGAAIAFSALLRGHRGPGSADPQSDRVDEEAATAFAER